MPNNKKTSLWSYIAVVGICGFALWCISSIVPSDSRKAARASHCQSNMNSLGKAIKSYMVDWDDHFPTNQGWTGKRIEYVPLNAGYKTNWVEGLYKYNGEKVAEPGANASVWKCPSAGVRSASGSSACVTYAINMNLLEQPEGIIKDAQHTLMLRELDRMYNAVCRPTNISLDDKTRPIGAFLTDYDPQLPKGTKINIKLHGPGSNILFTDGHVKNISVSYMPTDDKLYWDKTKKQWWNASGERQTIAITP